MLSDSELEPIKVQYIDNKSPFEIAKKFSSSESDGEINPFARNNSLLQKKLEANAISAVSDVNL